MALWQFATFTVLIAVLIVYAIIITRRLGLADARLTRMEEALLFLARSGSVNASSAVTSVDVDTPEVAQASPVICEVFESPAAPAAGPEVPQITAKPQVSAQEEARRVYLTMRDLRARSEQRATVTSTPDGVVPTHAAALQSETLEEAVHTNELVATANAESAAANAHDAPTTRSEIAAATILEIGDAPVTNTESQNCAEPDHRTPDDDASDNDDDDAAASKKNQEILVFLNAQRRRRRAHLGY